MCHCQTYKNCLERKNWIIHWCILQNLSDMVSCIKLESRLQSKSQESIRLEFSFFFYRHLFLKRRSNRCHFLKWVRLWIKDRLGPKSMPFWPGIHLWIRSWIEDRLVSRRPIWRRIQDSFCTQMKVILALISSPACYYTIAIILELKTYFAPIRWPFSPQILLFFEIYFEFQACVF